LLCRRQAVDAFLLLLLLLFGGARRRWSCGSFFFRLFASRLVALAWRKHGARCFPEKKEDRQSRMATVAGVVESHLNSR
jgi:hypothetical protein